MMKFMVIFMTLVVVVNVVYTLSGEQPKAINPFNLLIPPDGSEQQCKELGEACSISDECCTQRCAFYAHKCVT